MGVRLIEVIEAGGYDIRTEDDARWLLSTHTEYEQLIDQAQQFIDEIEEAEFAEEELEYERRWA